MISYEESGPRSLASTLEVPGHILKKTINGLSKGKTYRITVSAATVIGSGPPSRPVTGTVLLESTNGNDKMLSSYVLEAKVTVRNLLDHDKMPPELTCNLCHMSCGT